jgi:hypothetical protein
MLSTSAASSSDKVRMPVFLLFCGVQSAKRADAPTNKETRIKSADFVRGRATARGCEDRQRLVEKQGEAYRGHSAPVKSVGSVL